jgi:hypothetical protein
MSKIKNQEYELNLFRKSFNTNQKSSVEKLSEDIKPGHKRGSSNAPMFGTKSKEGGHVEEEKVPSSESKPFLNPFRLNDKGMIS